MCPKPAIVSPPPLMPTLLNPYAESWIPEAKKLSTTTIMFPQEIYGKPSPCFESFQQTQQPLAIAPHYFYYQASFDKRSLRTGSNFHGFCSHYYNMGFHAQPTTVLPGILSCVLDEKDIIEKRNSRVSSDEKDWKKTSGSLPPRFGMRRSRSLENQGTNKKTLKQVGKQRNGKSDDSVVGSAGGVVSSSSLTPPPSPAKEDFPFCKYTTVMIKNIPNQYRRNNLMQFLDIYCKNHNLEYDFLYLPMDFWRKDNLGYAFVNFTSGAAAKKIKDLLHGFKWYGNQLPRGTVYSKKICEILWADIQGKDALIKHFQNSNFTCDNTEYMPVVLSPPRNGSNSGILPITIGKMTGLYKFPRPMKK